MSSIDRQTAERIVEMKFDNKGFADGVKDTLKDLKNLDEHLKFENGVNGFKSLQSAANAIDLSRITNGVQNICSSLDYMKSFTFKVFDQLERKAINWATTMVKSMTVDQITKGGFKEYELKMDSVRTIMNSTGEKIEVVNAELEKLNKYADKTIYSFSDMTANIGKFTNAGVELKTATQAIQGISNLAAVSGANANEASRAMYNFSQALSSGAVKLIDWRSIENANMASKEFKQLLIDNAEAMGTLTKQGDKWVSTTADGQGKTSEAFDATSKFNESLSTLWMTTDVLVKTLNDYADESTVIGQKAFRAAQEVTTYSKMIDALREAVGSGWAQSFEIIIGDLTQATKFWTGINDVISSFISGISETRNAILKLWVEAGGRAQVGEALVRIFKTLGDVFFYIGLALETLFGHRYLENFDELSEKLGDDFAGNVVVVKRLSDFLVSLSYRFNQLTKSLELSRPTLEKIYQTTQAVLIPLRMVGRIIKGVGSTITDFAFGTVSRSASRILDLISSIGYKFTEGGLQFELYAFADSVVKAFNGLFDKVRRNLRKFVWRITRALGFNGLTNTIDTLADGFGKKVLSAFRKLKSEFENGTPTIKKFTDLVGKLVLIVEDFIVKRITDVRTFFTETDKNGQTVISRIQSFIEKIKNATKEGSKFRQVFDTVTGLFSSIGKTIGTLFASKIDFGTLFSGDSLLSGLPGLGLQIIETLFSSPNISEALDNIAKLIQEKFKTAFSELSKAIDLDSTLNGLKTKFLTFIDPVLKKIDEIKERLNTLKETISKRLDFKSLFKGSTKSLSKFTKETKLAKKQTKSFGETLADVTAHTIGFAVTIGENIVQNINWRQILEDVCQVLINLKDFAEKFKNVYLPDAFEKAKTKAGEFVEKIRQFSLSKPIDELEDIKDGLNEVSNASDETYTATERVLNAIKNNPVFQFFIEGLKAVIRFVDSLDIVGKIQSAYEAVSGFIQGAINTLMETGIIDNVVSGFEKIKEVIGGIDWSTPETAAQGIIDIIAGIGEAIDTLKFDGLENLRVKLNSIFEDLKNNTVDDGSLSSNMFTMMYSVAQWGINGLISGIQNFHWDSVVSMLQGLLGFYFIKTALGIFTGLGKTVTGTSQVIASIVLIIENFAGVITASKWQVLANALLTAAKSVAYIALSLAVLSSIPKEELMNATTALGAVILCLTLLTLVRSGLMKFSAQKTAADAAKTTAESAKEVTDVFSLLGTTVTQMSTALTEIGKSLTAALQAGFKNAGLALLVASFGLTMTLLMRVFEYLKNLKPEEYKTGGLRLVEMVTVLLGVTAILSMLADRLDLSDILKMAASILIFTVAIGAFSVLAAFLGSSAELWTSIGAGLIILAAVAASIGLVITLFNNYVKVDNLMKISGAIAVFGLALLALVPAITAFTFLATMNGEGFVMAIAAVGSFLLMAGLFMKAAEGMDKLGSSMGSFLKAAVGMALMSGALFIFAQAIVFLADNAEKIYAANDILSAFALIIITFTAVLAFAGPAIGAAAVSIGGGMLMFGAGIALIGAGIYIVISAFNLLVTSMQNCATLTMEQADAFSHTIGVVVYAIVRGIVEGIAMAIAALVAGLDGAVADLKKHFPSLVENLIALIIDTIGAILAGLLDVIIDFVKWMAEKLEATFPMAGAYLLAYAGSFVYELEAFLANSLNTLLGFIPGVGDWLKKHAEAATDAASKYRDETIQKARDAYEASQKETNKSAAKAFDQSEGVREGSKATQNAISDATNQNALLVGAGSGPLNEAAKSAFNMSAGAGEGIDTTNSTIQSKMPELTTSLFSAVNPSAGGSAMANYFAGEEVATMDGFNNVGSLIDKGADGMIDGLDISDVSGSLGLGNMDMYTSGIFDGSTAPVDASEAIGTDVTNVFSDLDMATPGSDNIEDYTENGIGSTESKNKVRKVSEDLSRVGAAAVTNSAVYWDSAGYNVVRGLANSIDSNAYLFTNAMQRLASSGDVQFDGHWRIASPSKLAAEKAMFIVTGLARSIVLNTPKFVSAMAYMADEGADTMDDAMSSYTSVIDGFNHNPTITPVLDVSRIQNGVNSIDSLLGRDMVGQIGATLSVRQVDLGSAVGELSSITNQGNSSLLDELRSQARQTERLIHLLENQKIYLDGNTMVGAMVDGYDRELGRRAILAGRRV